MGHGSDNINLSSENSNLKVAFAISVDVVILGYDQSSLKVLAIKSHLPPYEGLPALLGSQVKVDEELQSAASRVLKKHTGLENIYLQQLGAFDAIDRHPQGRVVTIGFFSLVDINKCKLDKSTGQRAQWIDIKSVGTMAFDHQLILDKGIQEVRLNIQRLMFDFNLLPDQFTLSELQKLQEIVLDKTLDKRNFRKRILNSGLIEACGKMQRNVSHRPAQLYQLTK